MPRAFRFNAALSHAPDSLRVGYSPSRRGGVLVVGFVGPDGVYRRRQTRSTREDANFHAEAEALVRREYGPGPAPDGGRLVADALAEVLAQSPLRPATLRSYRTGVKSLLDVLPAVSRVAAVDDLMCARYCRTFLATPYARSPKSDAAARRRSPVSLACYLRSLSAVWALFAEHGIVPPSANPWARVRKPEVPRAVKPVPTDDEYEHFVAWLRARYPGWDALHALVELKSLTCCRTLDIVQLKTDQLRDGRVCFAAAQVKTREAREVKLPPDLFATLRAVAGPEWLWGKLYDEAATRRPPQKRWPRSAGYRPSLVMNVVQNVFREYGDAHPGRPRLTPHSLRRRGITLLVLGTQNVDLAARAAGLQPQTARSYYLDAKRAFDTDAVFDEFAARLRPKPVPGAGPAGPLGGGRAEV